MDSLAYDELARSGEPRPGLRRWLRPGWPLYVALTLLLGAYLGLNDLIDLDSEHAAWEPFVWELSSALVILALIPVVVRVERRFPLDAQPRKRIIVVHVASAVTFSIVHTLGMVAIRKHVYVLAGATYHFSGGNILLGAFYELQKDAITYLVILLGVFAVREFRVRRAEELRATALAADLSEARLQHLTAQIEPHFLFNALNAISNRMHEDVHAADRMMSQLGDLLRAAYDTDDQLFVPLGREVEWLRGYAAMMAERYRGQLSFELEVEPGLETLTVPRLLLQPIVENAFRHGLGEGRGTLSVSVRRVAERLCYTISDDGVGLAELPANRGTGLSNVSRRLELLFPGEHELDLAQREPHGTRVTITFPVQT
jgi:two-component system, LytTR family, sensor kinase